MQDLGHMRSATGRRVQGCTHVYAAGVMAVLLLAGSAIESGYGPSPLSTGLGRRLLALLFAAALQIRRRYHDLHLFALFCCSPYPSTPHHLYHHYPSLPHRPRACSCSSHSARALSYCALRQKPNLLPPPPGHRPPPLVPLDFVPSSLA
jgi:hypothetical protein